MINLLNIDNFKAFEQQSIQFKTLTLLTGLNSTGKSSVLQSFLLLRQSFKQDLLPDKGLALNGELISIGTAKDALFEEAKEDIIGFEITWNNKNKATWKFQYDSESDVIKLVSPPNESDVYSTNLFRDNFYYLQAERIGSRKYFGTSEDKVVQHRSIDSKGEYAAHFLATYRDEDIPLKNLKHPTSESLNFRVQVEAWMSEISPGTKINIQPNLDLDLVSLRYSYGLSGSYRATNVGFGITYTLPILVVVLLSQPGTLILIENPEAHLHPQGQLKMGELLALAASCGVQIIVETHSDHVLNGIRLAVHRGQLSHENVQLNYFQRQEKDGMAVVEVVSPRMDKNGRINQWPDGFFDEWDKSLEALLEPAGE